MPNANTNLPSLGCRQVLIPIVDEHQKAGGDFARREKHSWDSAWDRSLKMRKIFGCINSIDF